MKPSLIRLNVLAALLLSSGAFADTADSGTEPASASAPTEPSSAASADNGGELQTVYVTAEKQAKQQLGVSTITAKDLQRMPVANDISEIVSKMPGVNLSTNSPGGERGNKRQIDIRSMGPDNTLILIDGKPVKSRNAERYGRSGVRNSRGDSNWVPPEMIESIARPGRRPLRLGRDGRRGQHPHQRRKQRAARQRRNLLRPTRQRQRTGQHPPRQFLIERPHH